MRDFTSYFIGIPLPSELQQAYEALLQKISEIDSNIDIVNPLTPHITIYYLSKFPVLLPSSIAKQIKSEVSLLANSQVTVSGFGSYGGQSQKVLFLDIICPLEIKQFRENISKILAKNSAQDNSMPFYPHMTVATIKAKNEFTKIQPQLKELLDKVTWRFPITELIIYGADSTQSPEYQEKLAIIPIHS